MLKLIEVLPGLIRDVNTATAIDEARECVFQNDFKDRLPLPPARQPTGHERWATAYHESAHAIAALLGGSTNIELKLRADATGYCRISPIEKAEHRINFALVGIISEARFDPRSIHRYTDGGAYDVLVARLLLDCWRDGRTWPPLTYTAATKTAIRFVADNWTAIKNVALALNDSGDLDDFAIRVFARCGYDG